MALTTRTHSFGINQLKIYEITEDSAASYTVGTSIALPGAKELSVDFEIDEKELYGDESILKVHNKIKKLTFSANYAELELSALPVLIGGEIEEVAMDTHQRYSLLDGDLPGYFQLQGLVEDTDEGSLILTLMKCKITSHALGGAEDDFQTLSLSGTGIKTVKTFTRNSKTKGLLLDVDFHSTEQTLSAVTA